MYKQTFDFNKYATLFLANQIGITNLQRAQSHNVDNEFRYQIKKNKYGISHRTLVKNSVIITTLCDPQILSI